MSGQFASNTGANVLGGTITAGIISLARMATDDLRAVPSPALGDIALGDAITFAVIALSVSVGIWGWRTERRVNRLLRLRADRPPSELHADDPAEPPYRLSISEAEREWAHLRVENDGDAGDFEIRCELLDRSGHSYPASWRSKIRETSPGVIPIRRGGPETANIAQLGPKDELHLTFLEGLRLTFNRNLRVLRFFSAIEPRFGEFDVLVPAERELPLRVTVLGPAGSVTQDYELHVGATDRLRLVAKGEVGILEPALALRDELSEQRAAVREHFEELERMIGPPPGR
jgi:hypothetical protein